MSLYFLLHDVGEAVELVLDVFEAGDFGLGFFEVEAVGVVGIELGQCYALNFAIHYKAKSIMIIPFFIKLNNVLIMCVKATEVDVEFVEVLYEGAEGGAFGHLGKGVDILGEALATIAELTIWTGYVCMSIVDVS